MIYHVQWPKAEYHEVLPRLYIGGHVWEEDGSPRDARHSTVSEDPSWDYVVSAYLDRSSFARHVPRCDTRFVLFDDTEDELSDDTWERISSAVDEVVHRWRRGQKVLVRCQAGYNRSGMLMAFVLMRLGYSADRAVMQIRWSRGKDVLANRAFQRYVKEREDEYRVDPEEH